MASALKLRTDYAMNPDKTENGKLISAFACDPHTADAVSYTHLDVYKRQPQGSGISPILANIYLNELDRHITEYKATFDCGSSTKRKVNPE